MQHLQPNTTLQGGKYRIERVLGQGGFGITYLARNTMFDVDVAIKEFFMKDENGRDGNSVTMPNTTKTELFKGQKEKFKKEAKRMFAIKNEHIVSVHDLFEENSTAYYVMEYVDGENLAEYLKRTGQPMSEKKVKKILPQIIDALKSVHDAGIWHLDMKPANILMDKSGNVKLIDFGASKQMNTQKGGATTSTAISYTNGYAPREQMEQIYDKFGPWTDIYALGATLYNLLTNQRPPLPTDIDDDMSDDKHLALPMPNVSDKMKQLILWLTKTNRNERPASVQGIIEYIDNGGGSSPFQKAESTVVENDVTVIEERYEPEHSQVEPLSQGAVRETDGHEVGNDASGDGSISLKKIGIIVAIGLVFILGGYYLYRDAIYYKSNYSDNDTIVGPDTDSDSIQFESAMLDKEELIKNLINDMVYVQGGEYKKGYAKDFKKYDRDDLLGYCIPYSPVNTRVSSFYICKYETTQDIWKSIMGTNPSRIYRGAKKPVVNVSWNLCNDFIKKLNNLSGKRFRLPTEAEWEFAAIGGRKNSHFVFSGSNQLDLVACRNKLEIVGSKVPNELGLFDMSGNAVEWCNDVSRFRLGDNSTPCRVLKGGSYRSGDEWMFLPQYFDFWNENEALEDFGFRLVLDDL